MIFGAPKYLRSISGTWRLRKQAPPETSGDLCHQAPRPGRTGCGWKAMWLAAVFRVGEQFWTFILFYIDIYWHLNLSMNFDRIKQSLNIKSLSKQSAVHRFLLFIRRQGLSKRDQHSRSQQHKRPRDTVEQRNHVKLRITHCPPLLSKGRNSFMQRANSSKLMKPLLCLCSTIFLVCAIWGWEIYLLEAKLCFDWPGGVLKWGNYTPNFMLHHLSD